MALVAGATAAVMETGSEGSGEEVEATTSLMTGPGATSSALLLRNAAR